MIDKQRRKSPAEIRSAFDQQLSFHFHESASLAGAFDRLAAAPYDAVLVGSERIDADAIATVGQLHASFPRIAIFLVAISDSAGAAERALNAGAEDCLFLDELRPQALRRALELGIERKRMESDLLAASEKFASLLRASMDSVTITTWQDGQFVAFNDAFLHMSGYSSDEAAGRGSLDLGMWVKRADRMKMLALLRTRGRLHEYEIALRGKSGEIRDCVTSAELVELGGVDCILAVTRDITVTKRLQKHVKHAHRSEALGKLAGGLVHDLNNWLTVILGHCELALAKVSPSDPMRSNIVHIKSAVASAESLTERLLALGSEKHKSPQLIDLNLAVTRVAKMLRRVLRENIDVIVRLDALPQLVKVLPAQLEHALLNLALNARDAMPDGGKLILETSSIEFDERSPELPFSAPPGRYIRLTVSDTGHGMDAVTLGHVFDEFFTTKPPGRGTGLGLCTVQDFVRQSGGFIRAQSEPGQGATFHLAFPAAGDPNLRLPEISHPSPAGDCAARQSERSSDSE